MSNETTTGGPSRRARVVRALVAATLGGLVGVVVAFGARAPWPSFGGVASGDDSTPATAEERSIRQRIAPRVAAAIDASNPTTRNLAVRLASAFDGPFRVEQVARIWAHVRARWRYVSDPHGAEYFARASETIDDGLAGDCDDFATVLLAMAQAIGGRGRFVMVDGDEGGHAYAEVCIDAHPDEVAAHLVAMVPDADAADRAAAREIHFRSDTSCPVWLGLDWSARTPGGPYRAERWAVAIHPDGRTESLAPALGPHPAVPAASAAPPDAGGTR